MYEAIIELSLIWSIERRMVVAMWDAKAEGFWRCKAQC